MSINMNESNMITDISKLPAFLYGTLIDIETTGLPYESAEVITLGLISGNRLQIIQRTKEEDFCKQALRRLKGLPRPYYAFNKDFEEQFLGIEIDRELQAHKYERKREAIRIAGLTDPFRGKGAHVVNAWNRYNSTRDKRCLRHIILHNRACLLLEACLVLVGQRNSMEV